MIRLFYQMIYGELRRRCSLVYIYLILVTIFVMSSPGSGEIVGKYDVLRQHHSNVRGHVTGLILARCGSKGIPFKNIAKIGAQSLLTRTLRILQAFKGFNDIWVSTDCNKIHHEALLAGALVHRRSVSSALDSASSLSAVQEFINDVPNVEIVGLFQCTSPFLALPFIHSAFSLLEKGYDSVFSVKREYKLRWRTLQDNQVTPVNFDPAHRPRRQDWNGEIVENGMFYFSHRKLISEGLLQGGRWVGSSSLS